MSTLQKVNMPSQRSNDLLQAAADAKRRLQGQPYDIGARWRSVRVGADEWLALNVFVGRAKEFRRSRWVCTRPTLGETVDRCVDLLQGQLEGRLPAERLSVVLEWVWPTGDVSPGEIHERSFDENRFEAGVTGYCVRARGEVDPLHYTPADAWLRSHISWLQVKAGLPVALRNAVDTNPESVRITATRSIGVLVAANDRRVKLWRGMPPPPPRWNVAALTAVLQRSIAWLHQHQRPSGRLRYYYDPRKDSVRDHAHMDIDGRYYNWLRHVHVTIPILDAAKRFDRPEYVETVRRMLQASIRNSVVYERDPIGPGVFRGARRAFLCNRKAKLGASGVGLASLVSYWRTTKDPAFLPVTLEVLRHVDSQILASGEFQGYYIHPLFNDGKPLDELSDEVRRQLFSFYYPGEALLGMAMALTELELTEEEKRYLKARALLALEFLLEKRPTEYAHLFASLPSDSWLVQAIEWLLVHAGVKTPQGIAFVKQEADALCRHMYKGTSPWTSYDGGFHYNFGDPVYIDGARMEGLMSAFRIALFLEDEEWIEQLRPYCVLGASSLLRLYNTGLHAFCFPKPGHGYGTWRLKLTRQWTRIDNTAHCYAALVGALTTGLVPTTKAREPLLT